ncbi:MAG: hypothetical protein Q4D62_06035 [Planctomycetia bacterium]|nr:hypothetical protein [Planctomycetia bacterium]
MSKACVVFLMDESSLLQQRMVESTKSKAEVICTAINSTLRQIAEGFPMDVALIGYHLSETGEPEVASRWGGVFSQRVWVSTEDLPQNPLSVEVRTKHVVDPVTKNVGEIPVDFPIWVEPRMSGGDLPRRKAFAYVADLLAQRVENTQLVAPPLVVSFLRDLTPADSVAEAAAVLGQVPSVWGFPILYQFHAGTNANVPAIKYPSSPQFLPPGAIQEMFYACSPLDEATRQLLLQNQEVPLPGAKGLVYNGRTIDLLRFMNTVKGYQKMAETMAANPAVSSGNGGEDSWDLGNSSDLPAFSPETDTELEEEVVAEAEMPKIPEGYTFCCQPLPENKPIRESETLGARDILVILLVDRSVSDLTYRPALDAWEKRANKTAFMLGELARRGRGRYDVSLIYYGEETSGTRVETDLLGEEFAADNSLVESAGKVETTTIQIPNGIGGLISLPRKKLWFAEANPTLRSDPVPAFGQIAEVIRLWNRKRPAKWLQPLVLHITGGDFQRNRMDEARRQLVSEDLPPVWLCHWIFTERPHVGVCCPSDPFFTEEELLKELWQWSDPLPGREILAGIRPGIHAESRGLMVNMNFDILFEVIDTMASRCHGLEG